MPGMPPSDMDLRMTKEEAAIVKYLSAELWKRAGQFAEKQNGGLYELRIDSQGLNVGVAYGGNRSERFNSRIDV